VTKWIKEVQADRRKVEQDLRGEGPVAVWSAKEISALVETLDDVSSVLRTAEPTKKAALYETLGSTLTYEPSERKVRIETDLSRVRMVRVGGGI
jgi:site-specific DNA recombinase